MKIPHFVRLWLLDREIDRGIERQRIARQERANAALRGMGKA